MRIAVLGSGLSGLFNAYRLAGKHDVTVYEKSNRIGGICSGFDVDGEYLDKYNHFFSKYDKELINLLVDLELGKKIIWKKAEQCLIYDGRASNLSSPLNLFTNKELSVIDKLRAGMFLAKNLNSKIDISLNDRTAQEWIINNCGMNVMKIMFRPLLKFKSEDFEDISAMYLKARLAERKHDKIGTIEGGIRTLVNTLRDRLHKNRANIWLNSNVKKLVRTDKGKWQVMLAQGVEEYDIVVGCIPISEAKALFLSNPGFPSVEYLNVGGWMMQLNRPISSKYWLYMVDDSNRDRHVIVNTAPITKQNFIYFPCYRRNKAIDEQTKQHMAEALKECLLKINPEFEQSWVMKQYFHTDNFVEPVFTQDFVSRLYSVSESFSGFYLSDLVYMPDILKTVNTALKKSAIIKL